jgi:CRISPR-associated protein Cas1
MERKTIYITNQGARLQRIDGQVGLSLDRTILFRWPVAELERVLIFGNAQVTTQVLGLLFEHGVHVSFFSSTGRYRGQLLGPDGGNVFLRLAQHHLHRDEGFRLRFAVALVREKIRSGRDQVRRYARNHPDTTALMDRVAIRLNQSLDELDSVKHQDTLRGVEGAAAASYFEAFHGMVKPPFRFEHRSRRPAHNEVNALLNLGYTLLTSEIESRLESAGFDPRVGYYHGLRHGRASLALDLLEIHRGPVIDRMVLSMLNRRMLAPGDFQDKGGILGVRLLPGALKRVLAHYEAQMGEVSGELPSPRAAIQAQLRELRQSVMAEAAGSREAA